MDSHYTRYGGSGCSYPPPRAADPNFPTAYAPEAPPFRQPPSWQSTDNNNGLTGQAMPAAQPATPWYGEFHQPAVGHNNTAGSGTQMPQPSYQPGPGPGPGLPAGPEATSAPGYEQADPSRPEPPNAPSYVGSNGWTWDGQQWRPAAHTGHQNYAIGGAEQQSCVGDGRRGTQWATRWNNGGNVEMLPPHHHNNPPSSSGQEPPAPHPPQPQRGVVAAADSYGKTVTYHHQAYPASSQPPTQVPHQRGSEGPAEPMGFHAPSYQTASCRPPCNYGKNGPCGGFQPASYAVTGKRTRSELDRNTSEPRPRSVARIDCSQAVGGEAATRDGGGTHGAAPKGIAAHCRPGSAPVSLAGLEHPLAKLTFWVEALPKGVKPDLSRGASAVAAAAKAASGSRQLPELSTPPDRDASGGSQQPRHAPAPPGSSWSQPPAFAPNDPCCDPSPGAAATATLSTGVGLNPASGPPPASDPQLASVAPAAAPANGIGTTYSSYAAAAATMTGEAAFVVSLGGGGEGEGATSSASLELTLRQRQNQQWQAQGQEGQAQAQGQQTQPQAQGQQGQAQAQGQQPELLTANAGQPPMSNMALRLRRQGLMLSFERRRAALGEQAGSAAAASSPTGSLASAPGEEGPAQGPVQE
ncbi:hypothetical protein Vretimale_17445 [Volvox reticuliferus]|uniref:Uncharacterized protein n=1 Tax=Volvox reticuliferus TaxID=1737510 RepID=A0A8J4CCL2_9CHLO|nr:hypothetical protein Vretifemale_9433 [Volvox reticuliferus]GIM14530.1 hypothetical protein Vretimale_17445 [Volvox reticuliferus]